ncbi:MAG TPA: myo-inosose-2 dehydratase [Hyphomicrobiaceae bacterium]|nr:myo-inosose-2 dehydratase [Hyphomicrobiaceae bacterium]
MSIRIGANPIGWSNDDLPELGGDTPLEVCLKEAKEAGFAGMELGRKFPRKAPALKKALEPFGLACVSGWYSAELLKRDAKAELKALKPHLGLLKAMGSKVLVFAETSNTVHTDRKVPLSKRPVLAADAWRELGRRMTEVAEHTLENGVRLVYHHHMGTVVQSADDIERLMTVTGSAVHLLLDTGHATWAGANPIALARRYKDRIAHVHAKDVRKDIMHWARLADVSFLDAVIAGVFTVPGDGMVDFPGVLKELKGYAGWIVVEAEQDPAKAEPLTYARLGYKNLRQALRKAGLKTATE